MFKNVTENYDILKTSKNNFGKYLVYFSKQYFEISGKIYYHGNDIPNDASR